MSVLATLLFSLSLLAGIIFLILCVATKIQKKDCKATIFKRITNFCYYTVVQFHVGINVYTYTNRNKKRKQTKEKG